MHRFEGSTTKPNQSSATGVTRSKWSRNRVLSMLISMTVVAGMLSVANVGSSDSESPPVELADKKKQHTFPGAKKVTLKSQSVKPKDGKLKLHVVLKLPEGHKINPAAPMGFLLETVGKSGPVDRSEPSEYQFLKPPKNSFDMLIPVINTGDEQLRLSMNYYHCQGDPETGVCRTGSVIWEIPIKVDDGADIGQAEIKYDVPSL